MHTQFWLGNLFENGHLEDWKGVEVVGCEDGRWQN